MRLEEGVGGGQRGRGPTRGCGVGQGGARGVIGATGGARDRRGELGHTGTGRPGMGRRPLLRADEGRSGTDGVLIEEEHVGTQDDATEHRHDGHRVRRHPRRRPAGVGGVGSRKGPCGPRPVGPGPARLRGEGRGPGVGGDRQLRQRESAGAGPAPAPAPSAVGSPTGSPSPPVFPLAPLPYGMVAGSATPTEGSVSAVRRPRGGPAGSARIGSQALQGGRRATLPLMRLVTMSAELHGLIDLQPGEVTRPPATP